MKENLREHRQKYLKGLFLITVFLSLFVFFTVVHPLYIYDGDDWTYIIQTRKAIPLWKNWNPTRVLPETLMPLVAEIGVRLFMPFNEDYILSMGIAFAIVLSLCYTLYFFLFYKIAKRSFGISDGYGTILTMIIILMHFLPFMNKVRGNGYMYASSSVTCVFYYTIPALLNAMLVMVFSCEGSFIERKIGEIIKAPRFSDGIWLLLIYLAINSNMFQSILLMSYICCTLLVDFSGELACRKKPAGTLIIQYCKKNGMKLLATVVWLLSLLMEANGGRAASIDSSSNFGGGIGRLHRSLFQNHTWIKSFFQGSCSGRCQYSAFSCN